MTRPGSIACLPCALAAPHRRREVQSQQPCAHGVRWSASAWGWRQPTDGAGVEVVDGWNNDELSPLDPGAQDGTLRKDAAGHAARIGFDRSMDPGLLVVPAPAPAPFHRNSGLDHEGLEVPDGDGFFAEGGDDGAASFVAEHHQDLGSQVGGRVFEGADASGVNVVAGDADDEEVADILIE